MCIRKVGKNRISYLPVLFCDTKLCQKCVTGRSSVPDPSRGVHDSPPDLAGRRHSASPHPLSVFGALILVPPAQAWCSSAATALTGCMREERDRLHQSERLLRTCSIFAKSVCPWVCPR